MPDDIIILDCPDCGTEITVGMIDWLCEPNITCPECGLTANIQVRWDTDA